ncbi:MAG: M17 family peptidase N-terminal domain-containing protein, partial [Xanthobacteraceae bacterium]|nr:M17 family peptidase N-terminal domain-containing protein [Xanthobacteraceae bacterium]
MSEIPRISFVEQAPSVSGVLVVLTDEELRFGRQTARALAPAGDLLARAAKAEGFKGKKNKAFELFAPAGLKAERLVVIGVGKVKELKPSDWPKLGGAAMGKIPPTAKAVTVLVDLPEGKASAEDAADFALGMRLRAYRFDRYKTKHKDNDDKERAPQAAVTLAVNDPAAARKEWQARAAVADGVVAARDLVNEPPNVLYPVEFARRAAALRKLGIAVDVLDLKAMKKLGMG